VIEVADLSVSFGHGKTRIDAVKHVSFAVASGESFGLVGESGSGKSTVVGAIAGLLESSPRLDRPRARLAVLERDPAWREGAIP